MLGVTGVKVRILKEFILQLAISAQFYTDFLASTVRINYLEWYLWQRGMNILTREREST